VDGDKVIVRKEYSGGLVAEVEVKLPAVLGIQASETPPRYVAYSKIRQVMGTAKIDEQAAEGLDAASGVTVSRMFQPESAERAAMLEGSPEDVSDKLIGIFKEAGAL
jgi:electron transfer flavoprotein beta subunit